MLNEFPINIKLIAESKNRIQKKRIHDFKKVPFKFIFIESDVYLKSKIARHGSKAKGLFDFPGNNAVTDEMNMIKAT